jgi:transcriptional regulator with XRE-family HTH domain
MKLKLYRAEKQITLSAFARKLGVAVGTLSRIEAGVRNASPDLMRRIYDATGGEVTPNDFVLPE